MKKILLLSVAILSSCGIYQSQFDCPAGEGVGCQSVNEVLGMIVDKEEGEDLFIQDPLQADAFRAAERKKRKPKVIVEEDAQHKLHLSKELSGESVLIQAGS